jgi:N-acetylglucosamine-6-phosphate deacetylase
MITRITNIDLLTPHKRIDRAEIRISHGRIVFAGPERKRRRGEGETEAADIDGRGALAVPGLIDIHLHGGGGADFMDGTPEAVRTVLRTHRRAGTTSVLATLMTAPPETIRRAVEGVNEAAGDGMILGLHLEGPHIAPSKRGAQPAEAVRPFDLRETADIARRSKVPVRIVTLAPELPGAAAYIRALLRRGIIPAAGHSAATFEQAIRGFEAGIRHGTHLFNAMSGIHHRDPGLAGALLLNEEASVEVIADGIHLHPATVFIVLTAKPADMVVLVTDATRPAGSKSPVLRTTDGKLYGSTLTLLQAVRNVVRWSGWPLEAVLPLGTANPARLLGIDDRKGFLKRGADADIVLLDKRLNVREVFVRGKRTFQGGFS